VVTAEDGVRHGGAGAFIVDAMETTLEAQGQRGPITRILGVPRQYIAQGKADDILENLGLNGAGIAESVRRARQPAPDPAPAPVAQPRT
jgi:1-deoxy-D-xylulose-5-phosphate synthase